MQKAWFKNWFNSPYYHQLYQNRNEEEASAFIEKLIEYLEPKSGSKMLDVACGKGRHSLALSQKGFDVTGIDISEESILEASRLENDFLHFYTHDMRLPFWINYFDYVFNFFTSFGYFKTQREHNNAIATMAKALNPGGSLILDYINVGLHENDEATTIEKEDSGVSFKISKSQNEHHFFKNIIVNDREFKEPIEFTEKVAKFKLPDFEKMFGLQNLKIEKVFGDMQLNEFDEQNSPRLIMLAKKNS